MATNPLVQNRACSKCGAAKPENAENFPRRKRCKAGLSPWCRSCENDQARQWRSRNKEKSSAASRRWRTGNPEKFRELYTRNNRNRSPSQAFRDRVSCAIARHLKGLGSKKDGADWEIALGWSIGQLTIHLERQFSKGMSWDNYGDWHIDHILPASSFCATSIHDPEFKACWALANLRPLWARENLSKLNRRTLLL